MEVGGWKLKVEGWKLEVEGWKLGAGGWTLEAGDASPNPDTGTLKRHLSRPVFHRQPGDAFELALVVRGQRDIQSQRVGPDPKVIISNQAPLLFERGANLPVRLSGGRVEVLNGDVLNQFLELR